MASEQAIYFRKEEKPLETNLFFGGKTSHEHWQNEIVPHAAVCIFSRYGIEVGGCLEWALAEAHFDSLGLVGHFEPRQRGFVFPECGPRVFSYLMQAEEDSQTVYAPLGVCRFRGYCVPTTHPAFHFAGLKTYAFPKEDGYLAAIGLPFRTSLK